MLYNNQHFINQRMLIWTLLLLAFFLGIGRGALPVFPTGEANIVLGDPVKRITSSLPKIKSMHGTDQNGTFIEAYLLENPDFIDAKEVWFILARHKLTQVDYIFTETQFSDFDRQSPVRARLNRYFGGEGNIESVSDDYEDATQRLMWCDYQTGEKALIDYLKLGGVRISFFNSKLKRTNSKLGSEPGVSSTPKNLQPPLLTSGTLGEIDLALQYNRPPNGTIFIQTSKQGHGELTIQNGTKGDAQVKLVSPTRKYIFISVYIHSGQSAVVKNIRPNTYKLIYALGDGWDDSKKRMFRIFFAAAFDKLLTFERNSEYYSTYRITLHPVEGGNVNSHEMSQDDFLSY